ncbi:MAG TPA: class I SAM-dependent methyltransferase [Acidimicrobiales bacterium]|nr:class I SAM-dependent methyltransferase [Acidimicrobiales bacterium]
MNPDELRRQVSAREWYHTIELAPGVRTPGWFDTAAVAARLPWPSLAGLRCLDVGTFDGFWAFEMERRGASEVVAVDVPDPAAWDWPAGSNDPGTEILARRKGHGEGFLIARDALGSKVERRDLSVYELSPDTVGRFDFVYLGSLLVHLRDPVGALGAVRSVCTGTVMVVDGIDAALSAFTRRPAAWLDGQGRPWWWKANAAGIVRMVEAAGLELIERPRRVWMKAGEAQTRPSAAGAVRYLRSAAGREALLWLTAGDPHICVLARPRAGAASAS